METKTYLTRRSVSLRDRVRTIGIVLFAVGVLVLLANVASACPTCKQGIAENDPAQQTVAAGFYYSIVFMMSMPFLILGTLGSFAFYSIRKAEAAQQAEMAADESAPEDLLS